MLAYCPLSSLKSVDNSVSVSWIGVYRSLIQDHDPGLVECLPSKCKACGSNFSNTEKKKDHDPTLILIYCL
jgi:hypothetical protein